MTGLVVIDVSIGLVFVYLLYSLLATILQEFVATHLSLRAKVLEKGISRMLDDNNTVSRFSSWLQLFGKIEFYGKPFSKEFYKHPLIKYLGEDKRYGHPAYLEAKNFSKVIIDLLRGYDAKPGEDFRTSIGNALDLGKFRDIELDKDKSDTLRFLKSLWADSQGDIEKFKLSLENWFDSTMERTTGWYKRYNQVIAFAIGFLMAIFFNVNTITIVHKLSTDPKLREQMVQNAQTFVKEHPNLDADIKALEKNIQKKNEELKNAQTIKKDSIVESIAKDSTALLNKQKDAVQRDSISGLAEDLVKKDIANVNSLLALGWDEEEFQRLVCFCENGPWPLLLSLLGWFLTAIAISLGAPFWFDLLNKLIKLRTAVKVGSKSDSQSDATTKIPAPITKG